MSSKHILLAAGVAVPLVYFGTIYLAGALHPGYSHIAQYGSELGQAGAPSAGLFAAGILLTAATTIAAAIGLALVALRLGGRRVLATLAGVALGLFGVGLVFGAVFPMPDPRHGGFGMGMAIHAAPLLLALALPSTPELRGLKRLLIVTTIVAAAFLAVMMGVGGFVTRANVGLFQRIYALTVFAWVGIASFVLYRHS